MPRNAQSISPIRCFADRGSPSALPQTITAVAWTLQIAWMAAILWMGSDAGMSMDGFLLMVLVVLILLPVWGWRWIVWMREHVDARSGKWMLGPCLMIACSVFVVLGGAFYVRFFVSRPALDRFAEKLIAAGASASEPGGPVSVGLFQAREVELLPGGVVRMITSRDLFDTAGVVYCTEGEPPVIGEDSYSPLGGGWWHWHRSW